MNGPLSNPGGINGHPNMGVADEQTMAAVKAVRPHSQIPLHLPSPDFTMSLSPLPSFKGELFANCAIS